MTSHQMQQQIETSQGASFWLKKAVNTAEGRDVLDALYDAEALLKFCQERAKEAGLRI